LSEDNGVMEKRLVQYDRVGRRYSRLENRGPLLECEMAKDTEALCCAVTDGTTM